MIFLSLMSALIEKLKIEDFNLFVANLILAAAYLIIGIVLGMLVGFILKKFIEKAEIEKTAKKSFVHLFSSVIRWSIYLLFVSIALDQLGIPQLTSWLSSVLVVIPALVGALILIIIGFAIAVYLRDLIKESIIVSHDILSMILFYFIFYVFLIFALKTALISIDKNTVNIAIIILTAIISASVAYWHVKVKKK